MYSHQPINGRRLLDGDVGAVSLLRASSHPGARPPTGGRYGGAQGLRPGCHPERASVERGLRFADDGRVRLEGAPHRQAHFVVVPVALAVNRARAIVATPVVAEPLVRFQEEPD